MKERFENIDPTKELREELCRDLRFYAQSDADFRALDRFKNGSFLFPGATTNKVNELLDNMERDPNADPLETKRLRELYNKIINEGL